MRSGSPIQFDIALLDAAGAGLSYANQAAFTGAGWALSFIDMSTGAAVSPSISYTISPVAGVTGRHTVACTLTTAAWFLRITPPSTAYSFIVLPTTAWTGEANDPDTIYSRLNSIYGVSAATAVPQQTPSPTVEGDSYSVQLAIPTSYLSRMGWTDISGCTLTGTVRDGTDSGIGTARADLVTGAPTGAQGKVAIGADNLSVVVSWDAYPSGMALTSPERTAGGSAMRITVEAAKGGKTMTVVYRGPLQVYAKDNPT
jgi:hypothetical protein